MRSNIIIAGGLFLFAALLLKGPRALEPGQDESLVARGIVVEMYQTAFDDFVVKLKDHSESFYIDATPDISLDALREKLLYRPVSIQYPDRWSPLKDARKHYITKLEYEGEIVFNDGK